MNIETTVVTRNENELIVSNIDIVNVSVDASLVDRITDKTSETAEDVAILIATIENAREISDEDKSNEEEPICERDLREGLISLLQHHDATDLCGIFEEMKYYQIKQVMESNNPLEEIWEYDSSDCYE